MATVSRETFLVLTSTPRHARRPRLATLSGLLLSVLTLACITSARAGELPLTPGTRLVLADATSAAEILGRRDAYIAAQSPLERQIRLGRAEPVTEQEFLRFCALQAQNWTEPEQAKIAEVVSSLAPKLARYTLPLPPVITLIKTTGAEEARAAYCRGAAIILPQRFVDDRPAALERLLTHELFHVLSSHNPALRQRLYAVVGFELCELTAYPVSLAARKITNPDAPENNYCIPLEHGGQPMRLLPVLFSDRGDYDPQRGGNLFAYLQFRLLQLVPADGGWQPLLKDGQPVLYKAEEVPAYGERIGRNTRYIIHPEEILADNFALLIHGPENAPSPQILKAMREILTRAEAAAHHGTP